MFSNSVHQIKNIRDFKCNEDFEILVHSEILITLKNPNVFDFRI